MKNTTKLNCTTTLGTNVPEQRIIEQSSVSSVKITAKNIEGFKEWLISEDRCTGTIEKYLRDIQAMKEWLAGRELSKENVSGWKHHLLESNYRPVTINSMLASVNTFCRYMDYGLAVRKRPGRTDYKVFTILPERIKGPVDTDYPGFLGKTMTLLYGHLGNGRFTNLDAKRLAGDKGWKQMRENIGCLVRRRLIEQRKYSHNESEFCLSVNPQDWPVFFLPDDRKKDQPARTYTGGSAFAGPAVSYAAAGV